MKLIWIAALCAASATHAQTNWKLATGYRADSFHTVNIIEFAREVNETTQGELSIEVVPQGSLIKLNDIFKAVQGGEVSAGETIMSNIVNEVPVAGADSVPFVVIDYVKAKRLWQVQRPIVERDFQANGLKILFSVPWPPQGLYATRPIKTAADFKKMKMRTYNQTTVRIAEMLGATPVDVTMLDVGKAVSEGRLESMITSAITGVENKVWGGLGYYYEINAWFPKNIVFANAKAFNALTPKTQAAILKAADRAETRGWATSKAVAQSSTAELQKNGMRIERLPLELEADIKRMGERFSLEWVRSVGFDGSALFVPFYFN